LFHDGAIDRPRDKFKRLIRAAGSGGGTSIKSLHHNETDAQKRIREIRPPVAPRDGASRQRLDQVRWRG
jgi:hypothetical protein